MGKVALFNLNNNNILNTKPITFVPGQVIKAKVLQNNTDGLLLLIGENKILAKTDFQFPVGTSLNLYVVDITKENIVLSLNKNHELEEPLLDKLLYNLELEANDENKEIINKLIEQKIKISKKNIKLANFLVNQLPVNKQTGLELITDPTLFTAIFSFFKESEARFSLIVHSKEVHPGEPYFEINILYDSKDLGYILTNINWSKRLKISFICSTQSTLLILQDKISDLNIRLKYISDLEIYVKLDDEIFENINNQDYEKIQIKGIDIWI